MADYGDEHFDMRDLLAYGHKRKHRTLKPRKRAPKPYALEVPTIGPWLTKALAWVRGQEETRTGKKLSKSRVVRGLLQLGVYRYRDLGQLPDIGRFKKDNE